MRVGSDRNAQKIIRSSAGEIADEDALLPKLLHEFTSRPGPAPRKQEIGAGRQHEKAHICEGSGSALPRGNDFFKDTLRIAVIRNGGDSKLLGNGVDRIGIDAVSNTVHGFKSSRAPRGRSQGAVPRGSVIWKASAR